VLKAVSMDRGGSPAGGSQVFCGWRARRRVLLGGGSHVGRPGHSG